MDLYLHFWTPEGDRERFKNTLKKYLAKVDLSLAHAPRVLELGCGYYPAADVLDEVLSGFFNQSIHYLGMDSNPDKIAAAKSNSRNSRYRFIHGDARKIRNGLETCDMVVARHPDVFGNKDWKKIFRQSYRITGQGGILFSTCYNRPEMERIGELICNAGYRLCLSEENSFGTPTTDIQLFGGWLALDGYVIVGKK